MPCLSGFEQPALEAVIASEVPEDAAPATPLLTALKRVGTLRRESEKRAETELEQGSFGEWAPYLLVQAGPFAFLAGIGLVCTGIVLDQVQRWDVFAKYNVLFILVPALLGLKGNLEMTLASRLSTYETLGYLEGKQGKTLIVANLALVQAQAVVVAILASFYATGASALMNNPFTWREAGIVFSGSVTAACASSGILATLMSAIVLVSPKLGIDPDNVATPIAATLGDLITLSILAGSTTFVHNHADEYEWLPWVIVVVFVSVMPFWLVLAMRHDATTQVLKYGWPPIIMAMIISSAGGVVLERFIESYNNFSLFDPVINGVGGNFAAVHASRLSTSLHLTYAFFRTSVHLKVSTNRAGPLLNRSVHPNDTVSRSHVKSGCVLWALATGLHSVFLLVLMVAHHSISDLTITFSLMYMTVAAVQIALLLVLAHWLVLLVWRRGGEPDNVAIPYVTAFGDLIGTGLLALGFVFNAHNMIKATDRISNFQ